MQQWNIFECASLNAMLTTCLFLNSSQLTKKSLDLAEEMLHEFVNRSNRFSRKQDILIKCQSIESNVGWLELQNETQQKMRQKNVVALKAIVPFYFNATSFTLVHGGVSWFMKCISCRYNKTHTISLNSILIEEWFACLLMLNVCCERLYTFDSVIIITVIIINFDPNDRKWRKKKQQQQQTIHIVNGCFTKERYNER